MRSVHRESGSLSGTDPHAANESWAYLEVAEARLELGDRAGAEAALARALTASPRDPAVLSFARRMHETPAP